VFEPLVKTHCFYKTKTMNTKSTSLTLLFLCALGLLSQNVSGQNNFGTNDSIVLINKTTAFGVAHNYAEVYNYTGADMPMHWERRIVNMPSAWLITLGTPAGLEDINATSDSDFILSDSSNTAFPDKLVIGVDHTGVPGIGKVIFNIYPVANPADSFSVTYRVSIVSAVGMEEEQLVEMKIGSLGKGMYQLPFQPEVVDVFDLSGRTVPCHFESEQIVQLSTSLSGIFIIRATSNGEHYVWKVAQ